MNILYLIGNGFDINLGLKTRYKDFYKYYSSIKSESKLINDLKVDISRDIETWSDLESALGLYTENLKSLDEFDEIYKDLGKRLSEFLQVQENNLKIASYNQDKLYNHLIFPEKSLPKGDENRINYFKEKWSSNSWIIDIITFNYTRTLEKLLNEPDTNIKIGTHHGRAPVTLRPTQHIHGYLNKRMIMGVNDISQIKNVSFRTNRAILESLVKIECNKAIRHTIDDLCINRISKAHLICIFGSSIGTTDKIWWEKIGERLKKQCILIIYAVGDRVDPRTEHLKNRYEQKIKKDFFDQTLLTDSEIESLESSVFVSYNSDMFILK